MSIGLQLHDVAVLKGYRPLFPPLSLNLQAGDILHVSGANGSGKTTLLRALAGLNRQYQGHVCWRGQDIQRDVARYTSELLFIGHSAAVKASLNALENLAWYVACDGASDADCTQALKALRLHNKRELPCFQLSAGQQRRVALCRLLFNRAPLWVLDEPLTALDSEGIAVIRQAIAQQRERGGITLLTTHHGAEALDLPLRRLTLARDEVLLT